MYRHNHINGLGMIIVSFNNLLKQAGKSFEKLQTNRVHVNPKWFDRDCTQMKRQKE